MGLLLGLQERDRIRDFLVIYTVTGSQTFTLSRFLTLTLLRVFKDLFFFGVLL
jgi:hypothetical protein